MSDAPTTSLCTSSADDILVRGRSLPRELMGHVGFSQMLFFVVLGRMPTDDQAALVDACLVTLMEHGLTPTAVSTRLTYTSAPEAMQGAVAAGLLSVGSLFVGTVEGNAALLHRIVESDDAAAEARAIVAEHRAAGRHVPGFGHPIHKPVDPRTERLRELSTAHGGGLHWPALDALDAAIAEARGGRRLPPNATAAVAAVLSDCGVPPEIMRGFALVSRCGGLVGHIHEEQHRPAMRALWHGAESAVPYASPDDEENR
jgi:citrate synthase